MGMHYARHDGEAEDVAVALNEQYQPRYAGDALPQSLVACSPAIADKMDTPPASSASGSIRKAIKTRSRCAAPHWACCASSSRKTCRWICRP